MIDGNELVQALRDGGVTHVVWIPDTHLGQWESALRSAGTPQLVRVCREGEAYAVAAGLLIAGQWPIVMIQCTGFFEAGDALRNVIHDMKLPLFQVVGVRSHKALQKGKTDDSCPVFSAPIMETWKIPHVVLDDRHTAADLVAEYRKAKAERRAGAVLIAE